MNKAPRQTLTAPIRRIRFAYVALFFCAWTTLIAVRLGWLQVVRHSDFVHRAAMQQQRTFEVAPRRGMLYDRNLRELAVTVQVDSVYAVPSELGDNRASVAEILAEIVHADPTDNFTSQQQMLARFNASRNFAWVARKVDPSIADRLRELNLKGVYFQKEFKRFYPNNDLAAQVLGYVGTDDIGLGGLERQFDEDMHGEPGHMLTALDAKRHVLGSEESQPMPGENLVLSIDANIQYMAERALDAQMLKTRALHGTVVVQDPHTGQILALAISPRFNPNDQKHMDSSVLQNLAVSDVYEPGSTFKLVTYSAALDGAGVQPTDLVDCQNGAMTMYGRTLHDDHSDHFGVVTVQYALEHSSDVGAAKMALKLGPNKFYSYMRGFGFGDRSGIELPSETRGLLRAPKKWGSTSILSMAIGQEVGVTPVQLVTMVSALANGGVYMPPHVLLQSTDEMKGDARLKPAAFRPSNQLPTTLPDGAHRVISEMTSAKMRMMMQGIVTEGTGKLAALNGYSSAGKTGTAQKIDVATHTYSHTKLVASFAGFAPVSNPAISIAVVIDTPTAGGEAAHYGGAASAPVFADVAQQVLEYLGVPHDQPLKTKKELQIAQKDAVDDSPADSTTDLSAMFDDVNSLPADDPLRAPANAAPVDVTANVKPVVHTAKAPGDSPGILNLLPAKVLAAFRTEGGAGGAETARLTPQRPASTVETKEKDAVVVDASLRVPVPLFDGLGLRGVVEKAGAVGLRVQAVGSGLAREQVPAAGTMVGAGTEIVVRFSR
ncbi:penicillin-binding transpeptidase domain-containing protein [Tunturiibacter gelidoferens]|uniref:Cell division protein FtsI (Penicillin-binding protein 3) n=1 Tax=Tunturiibacter gelidiferens TaxID=3069689 RepID=A0A9X0QE11_9BACT|nr:penicillin-binding transpeptidase domain-containing protein [Edaphobacter lichenicola]MBB5328623.1 cell division protein FtsI (penicillin-binding protein 3) [Edaphobacter lichenicola]